MRYNAAIAAAVVLAGCTATTDVRQSDTTCIDLCAEMRVSPANAVLNVGDRLTFAVTGSRGGVTWASSDTTVVTVDRYGSVQALRVGSAAVVASSAADSRVKAAAAVTVSAAAPVRAFISVTSINYVSTGMPANLDSVSGTIDVAVSLVSSSLTSETRLVANNGARDTVVASNTTPLSTSQGTQVHLIWNTSATTAGTRAFPAGRYTIRAQAFAPTGEVANTATVQVFLRNP